MRRADHSSRGVLGTLVRRCVLSSNLKNEEAMTRAGSQRHRKKKLGANIFRGHHKGKYCLFTTSIFTKLKLDQRLFLKLFYTELYQMGQKIRVLG